MTTPKKTMQTPQKWTISELESDPLDLLNPSKNGEWIMSESGDIIATVHAGPDVKVNSTLIAAAPELLAALQILLQRAQGLDQRATATGMTNCDAIAKARAAIQKATNAVGKL